MWSSWCHCHPETPSSLASFKYGLVLIFCYQLTQAVLEKTTLNGCSVVVVKQCWHTLLTAWKAFKSSGKCQVDRSLKTVQNTGHNALYVPHKSSEVSATYTESGIERLHQSTRTQFISRHCMFVSHKQHKFVEGLLHVLAPVIASLRSARHAVYWPQFQTAWLTHCDGHIKPSQNSRWQVLTNKTRGCTIAAKAPCIQIWILIWEWARVRVWIQPGLESRQGCGLTLISTWI